jgi:molybdopterin synthase catalytic subunit
MKITVKLFASTRELFGASTIERDLPDGATVGDLLELLRQETNGKVAPGYLHVAIDKRYAGPNTVLRPGDEAAVFPPVSGGAGGKRFWLSAEPLSLDALAGLVTAPERGGIVLFSGTVRGITGPQNTDYLEYEAYAEMAEAVLAQIGAEVQEKWPQVLDIAIVHRTGRLDIGESSVMVAVAGAHRQGLFDACAHAIERLKQVVPIWKKEVGPDGSYWVEGPHGA